MWIRLCSACAALAVALAGCSATRYASRSEHLVELPESFGAAGPEAGHAPRFCKSLNIPWVSQLTPRLRRDSFELAQSAARVRQAQAAARAENAARWPALSAALSAERAKSFTAGLNLPEGLVGSEGGPRTRYRGSVAAEWELDLWGRLAAGGRAAALELDAARAQREALWISLSAELADALTSRLQEQAVADLLVQQQEVSRRFLELTELRFGQGLTSAADIVRQRQQLEAVQAEIALANARIAAARARLAALLGSADELLPESLPPLPAPDDLPAAGLPANVIESRPDVAAAYLQLAASDERSAAAVARRLPSVNLSASAFDVRSEFSNLFDSVFWQVLGEATMVIFDAGSLEAQANQAESRAEEALYAYAQAVVDAFTEIQSALANNIAQDQRGASLREQLIAARQALTLERELYMAGQRDYLSVLTALQSLQQVERQNLEALAARFQARISLCRALGLPVGASRQDPGA